MPASMQRRIRQGAQVVRLPRVSRQLPPREQAVGEGLVMLCRRKNSRHGRHEETPFLALVAALSPHTTQPVWLLAWLARREGTAVAMLVTGMPITVT